jgi:hypothetical protein
MGSQRIGSIFDLRQTPCADTPAWGPVYKGKPPRWSHCYVSAILSFRSVVGEYQPQTKKLIDFPGGVRGQSHPIPSTNRLKKTENTCPFFRGKYKHQRTAATTQSSETADRWRGGCSSSRRDGRERCAAALDETFKDSSHDSCPTRASRCHPRRGQRLHQGGCSS